jgi:hypothetical protein
MPALLVSVALLLSLWAPAAADASSLCRWTGFCLYLSPGFTLTVVDVETGRPITGVYAWAEWVQYGAHGRGGPLMVQDATSDAAGALTFPHWGPRLGSRGGLLLGIDPAVILFKSGYATLLVENGVPPGASHHAAVRAMSRNRETLRLQPFRGSPAEWVEELRKLVHPALSAGIAATHRDRFRTVYLRRTDLIHAELSALPPDLKEVRQLRSSVERDEQFYRRGSR